jgi:hypothetical protein
MALGRIIFLCSVLHYRAFAATVIPLTMNLPKAYESNEKPVTSQRDLLSKLNPSMANQKMFFSSYNGQTPGIYASQDSFIRGAIDAGAKHQHLLIRPQDVWITILKQLTSYLRKHKDDADVLGKWDYLDRDIIDPLQDVMWWGMMDNVDGWMQQQVMRRNKTNWLVDWVHPNFPTTLQRGVGLQKSDEEMIANALMMSRSTPTPAWENGDLIPCQNGIPSITLLGTQAEWEALVNKLQPLKEGQFGSEPRLYALNLDSILRQFAATFRDPNNLVIRTFWNDIVTMTAKQRLCQTTDMVTGWVNAFHFWNGAGDVLPAGSILGASNETLEINGVFLPGRKLKDLPTAHSNTPMCIGDEKGGASTTALMGMLGKSIKKGKPEDYAKAMQLAGFRLPSTVTESDHSMLQPLPAWMAYAENNVSFFPILLTS